MSEFLFPIVGAAIVFTLAVPLLTLVAQAALAQRPHETNINQHASPWRLALIVGPTLGPIVWLISATIHQSEEGEPIATCIIDHLGGELCRDVAFFGLLLFAVLGAGILGRLRAHRLRPEPASNADTEIGRIHRIVQRHAALAAFSHRIRVVENGAAPICTRGMFRPSIELEPSAIKRLDDSELEAVLLHELEHAHSSDPLRLFLAQVALSINPLGRLLKPALSRYQFGREAQCDRIAVQRGADPVALAHSIVLIASPVPATSYVSAVGGHSMRGIRLRVQLLLGYAESSPRARTTRQPPVGVLGTLTTLLVIFPHLMGTGPLDSLHHAIERTALILGLG